MRGGDKIYKGHYSIPENFSHTQLDIYKEKNEYVAYGPYGEPQYGRRTWAEMRSFLNYRGYKRDKWFERNYRQ